MRVLILVSAVCMQFVWSHGLPAGSKGVGAFAYQDSTGNRYGATYDLEDGKVVNVKGSPPGAEPGNLVPGKVLDEFAGANFAPGNFAPANFGPGNFAPFLFEFPDFFPDEFKNLQSLFQEDFVKGFEDQDIAGSNSGIASKSGDDTHISRFGGFGDGGFGSTMMPGYGMNFQGFGMPGMGMPGMGMPGLNMGQRWPGMGMPSPMMGPNSAFAGAAAGPGYVQHQDFISPMNPNMPNVNVMKYTEPKSPGSGQFYSVSSKSYSSSSNLGGKEFNSRGSETMVNDNGDVTKYSVHN